MGYVYPIPTILVGSALALLCASMAGTAVASAGFPLPRGHHRIGCIDGLRGYLALFVMIHHFVIWTRVSGTGEAWGEPSIYAFNNFGAGGVALFFMTTGAVFYPRIRIGFRATSWRAVFAARVFRILPLVALSTTAVVLVIVARTGAVPSFADLVPAAAWIGCWSQPALLNYPDSGRIDAYVLWSLRYEWVFYLLILPACALAMDVVKPRAASWAVPVALLAVSLSARALHGTSGLAKYAPLFAIGMLAYEVQGGDRVARVLRAPWMAMPATASLVLGLTSAPDPYQVPQLALLGFFFAVVAAGNDLFGVLSTRGALALGECSYGIYLLHGICLDVLFVDGGGTVAAMGTAKAVVLLPAAAAMVSVVTALVYVLFERPIMGLGRRVSRSAAARRPSMDDPALELAP